MPSPHWVNRHPVELAPGWLLFYNTDGKVSSEKTLLVPTQEGPCGLSGKGLLVTRSGVQASVVAKVCAKATNGKCQNIVGGLNFMEMMMFSGMRSKKPEPNPYSKIGNIESEVAKELARDVHISFMMTSTEIDACETKKDIERMVDVYIDSIKTVMLSRIFIKHPRFLGE